MKKRPQPKSAFQEATNELDLVKNMIESQNNIAEIPLSLILSPKTHDRKCFDENEIVELAKSIKTSGLLQPIIVRKIGNQFERLIGFKRVMATKLNNETTIKAIVLSGITDEQASLITISENLFRSDPNAYDQTLAFLDYASIVLKTQSSEVIKLLNKFKAGKEKNEAEERNIELLENIVAKNLSINLRTLSDKIKVLGINPLLIEAIQKRKITYQEAIAINKLNDDIKITALLKQIDEKELTLKEIKDLVLGMQDEKPKEENSKTYSKFLSKSFLKNLSKIPGKKLQRIEEYLKKIEEVLSQKEM
ncbi:ParB/RepB/Spo0J family partition protein [Sulfurimonas sp.]|uniref:ParB/RepB/Spo0J family partition protein n=1 Tax=Sulfurimonas sp. TaxID=2022749 RepID=UPI0025F7877A|nr:ParB/RepB/Spo0J family partition protein [Sulfurimonas sp.]MBW6487470.1 ParB/RepB/Spo0J family partition protein [Sulfurimonas sp.]